MSPLLKTFCAKAEVQRSEAAKAAPNAIQQKDFIETSKIYSNIV